MGQAARKMTEVQKSAQDLAREVAAAAALREALATMTDDGDVIRDTIEGETSLHEAIAKVDEFILDDESLIEGIKRMQETLDARKQRIEKRIDYYRSAIEQALVIGEVRKLELATGTISLRTVAPKLEIIEESEIPTRFWVVPEPEPKLDKKALTEALKQWQADYLAATTTEGRNFPDPIPGAKLSDEGVGLTIRRA